MGADRPRRPEGAQRAQGDRESGGGKGGGQEEGGPRARSRGTIFAVFVFGVAMCDAVLVEAQLRASEAKRARGATIGD